jgi:hypothetical protein
MQPGVSEQNGLNNFRAGVVGVNLRRNVALNRTDKMLGQVSVIYIIIILMNSINVNFTPNAKAD